MKLINLLKITSIIIFALGCIDSYSQVISFPINSIKIDPSTEGFIYSLPRNTLKIDVQIKKTEKFKGKFSDYATKMLGVTDFISKDVTSYSIANVEITTIAEVDSSQIYYAQLPSSLDDDQIVIINQSPEGFISGYEVFDKESDDDIINNTVSKAPFRDLLKPVLIEKVDTIVRRVSIDTSVFEEKFLKRSISEKSNEQQAREIADLIYRIQDSKFSLITGYQEVNYSKESMQFMIDKLNLMESEYIAFFKGSVIESKTNYTFYYTPDEVPSEKLTTLFRFSSVEGISDKQHKNGDEVTVSVIPQNFYVKAREIEKKRATAKRKAKGLFYRIPESVIVNLKVGNTILGTNKSYISQMGILTFLPYNNLSSAEFNVNGSLKTIVLD